MRAQSTLKEKAAEELRIYWVVFAFLALMFGAFTIYRRLILSEVGISYAHYGAGLIKAAVIAKVILIGQALKLGRRFERHALIVVVLVKSALYGLLVAIFTVLERVIEGLARHESWPSIAHRLLSTGSTEILAQTLVMIVAFLPFFALWETGRVLGEGSLAELFLHRKAP